MVVARSFYDSTHLPCRLQPLQLAYRAKVKLTPDIEVRKLFKKRKKE